MIATQGQNIIDATVQTLGTVEALFDFLAVNNLDLTDSLSPGQSYQVPISTDADVLVVAFIDGRNKRVNTGSVAANGSFNSDFNSDFD